LEPTPRLGNDEGLGRRESATCQPGAVSCGHISGAQRQPNGNVLVCEGASGRLSEITRRGETVWEWVSPFTTNTAGRVRAWVFHAYRCAPDYPGLRDRSLDPAACADLNRLDDLQAAHAQFVS
jgi:hypothetical protein